MTGRDLKRCHKTLVSLRSSLLAKMKNLDTLTEELQFSEGDMADRALGSYVQEMQLYRSQWNFQRLSMVEEALDRIDRQTYGVCEECGEPIRGKRLAAIPWARLCLACKTEEEQARLSQ